MSTGRDGWRLAVGTLTTIPVRPPSVVDRAVAGRAMLLAPLAALPLALIPLLAHTAIRWLGMPPLLAAALTVAALALANRGLHVDGLADTADGLAASYDRDRALEVMRRGDVGPAGVTTVVLVLLIQVIALADLLQLPSWDRPLLAALAVAASRHTLAWVCGRAFPAARPEGLGAAVAGSVPWVRQLRRGSRWPRWGPSRSPSSPPPTRRGRRSAGMPPPSPSRWLSSRRWRWRCGPAHGSAA